MQVWDGPTCAWRLCFASRSSKDCLPQKLMRSADWRSACNRQRAISSTPAVEFRSLPSRRGNGAHHCKRIGETLLAAMWHSGHFMLNIGLLLCHCGEIALAQTTVSIQKHSCSSMQKHAQAILTSICDRSFLLENSNHVTYCAQVPPLPGSRAHMRRPCWRPCKTVPYPDNKLPNNQNLYQRLCTIVPTQQECLCTTEFFTRLSMPQ